MSLLDGHTPRGSPQILHQLGGSELPVSRESPFLVSLLCTGPHAHWFYSPTPPFALLDKIILAEIYTVCVNGNKAR